jgi:hypothetical protein
MITQSCNRERGKREGERDFIAAKGTAKRVLNFAWPGGIQPGGTQPRGIRSGGIQSGELNLEEYEKNQSIYINIHRH